MPKNDIRKNLLRCSFCNKDEDAIDKLISSPGSGMVAFIRDNQAFICNQCVAVCDNILLDEGILSKNGKGVDDDGKGVTQLDLTLSGIKPPFKTSRFELKRQHCFHLCPFLPPFEAIYLDTIIPTAKSVGFVVERADEIFGTEAIIEDIWQRIGSSQVITADVTGKNPNVMYEVGMAHALGKPVILMTQDINDVPFDLRHHRCIIYEYTPRGCAQLAVKLKATLQSLQKPI